MTTPADATPIAELAANWRSAGLADGDTVLIHSDLRRLVRHYLKQRQRLTPELVLDSFREAVGETGTLLLPLFNFAFNEGVPFDLRTSPSAMGAMTEAARLAPGAVRTGHPVYSFAVLGAQAERFREVDNRSGYGADSPFAILRELNGKIAVLDLPERGSMTFYHHVEEMLAVDYRYHKAFTGSYTDGAGHTSERTYGLYVRKVEEGVKTIGQGLCVAMWEKGIWQGCQEGQGHGLRVCSARACFDYVSYLHHTYGLQGLLYRLDGKDV